MLLNDAFPVFDSLAEKQHETLMLATRRLTSKQIAQELGVAPVTIDKRIEGLRARLGFIARSDLLRLYRQWREAYDRAIDDPIILADELQHRQISEAPQSDSTLVFQDRIAFDARASWDRQPSLLRPGPKPSDLGIRASFDRFESGGDSPRA